MFVLMVVVLSHFHWNYKDFIAIYATDGFVVTVTIVLFSIAAFLIGEVLDSIRDLLEWILDRKSEVNWDYLVTAPRDQAEQFDNYYYTYYVLNFNLVLAFVVSSVMIPLKVVSLPDWAWRPFPVLVTVVAVGILSWDAYLLRGEIARITEEQMNRLEAERKRSEEQTDGNRK